ncbi:MAG: type II secretion system F family protein [Geminicoccaceae bacterium]
MMSFLADLSQLAGGTTQLTALVAVFIGVTIAVVGIALSFSPEDAVERRLSAPARAASAAIDIRRGGPGGTDEDSGFGKVIAPTDEKERYAIQERLIQAGFRQPNALFNYYLIRTVLGILIPLPLLALSIIYALSVGDVTVQVPILGWSLNATILFLALLVLLGFYIPTFVLSRRIKLRQRAIREGFPHALDMMQVSVEAGLGFDAGLARVAKELQTAHPVLAEEFFVVGLEMRAGKPREEVLRDLGRRTGVEEVLSFASVINQSVRYGTSISDALNVYAKEMRHKRMMRAEELANQLPVKMSICMVLFLLPTLFIIFLGPMAIRFVESIGPLLKSVGS